MKARFNRSKSSRNFIPFKGAASRFAHPKKFSLHFSSSSFVIVLIFSILNFWFITISGSVNNHLLILRFNFKINPVQIARIPSGWAPSADLFSSCWMNNIKIQKIIVGGFWKSYHTYFSLWYCFMLFQQEIQVITITVFKDCTEPEDIHKTTETRL